ncbi:MAG TPA: site-specific integrase [Steroidobacteraceae bacterium]|nr:site-specific integrase [Steroidobacteraceae bacterium]
MQAVIGPTLLSSKVVHPTKKPFEIYDSRLSGFTLRVQPSGVRSYYARFGRNRRVALGQAGTIEPEEARERCQKVLGNVAHGRHPLHGLGGTDGVTLGMFIADTYTTWVQASRPRTAADTLEKLHRHFRTWYPEPLTAITVERVEAWKVRRLNEGRNPVTVVRDLYTLSSVLRRAVKAGELTENPVRRVDKPRVDRRGKVRFLDHAEETRLRQALKARDEEMRSQRTLANNRRQAQQERTLPPLTHFGDHLTPAVLLSMNTGLRRGETLKLRWGSVDFNRQLLTVEGPNAKSRQTRHVELNEEAVSVLRLWREQSGTGARVFGVTTGFQSAWEKVLKRARISKFRWHDLRHHFASRLVQKGVPLNTVRDLLGHGSVGMSLRYAHLAPDQRREAVSKLNERPLLTLTMRLQWEGLPAVRAYRVDSIMVREEQELAGQIPLFGNPSILELRL